MERQSQKGDCIQIQAAQRQERPRGCAGNRSEGLYTAGAWALSPAGLLAAWLGGPGRDGLAQEKSLAVLILQRNSWQNRWVPA